MHKIQELFRMVPDGTWKLNDAGQLVDPENNIVDSELTPVQKKLYATLMQEMLNRVPHILWDLDAERRKVAGLFKEIRHVHSRIQKSYQRGVNDCMRILEDVEIRTPTARDALTTASENMKRLINDGSPVQTSKHNS
jgi:hypothetical protein